MILGGRGWVLLRNAEDPPHGVRHDVWNELGIGEIV